MMDQLIIVFGVHSLGSKTPDFLNTSATMGTVELTGLEITNTKAFGAVIAISVAKSFTMPALIWVYVNNKLRGRDKSIP